MDWIDLLAWFNVVMIVFIVWGIMTGTFRDYVVAKVAERKEKTRITETTK